DRWIRVKSASGDRGRGGLLEACHLGVVERLPDHGRRVATAEVLDLDAGALDRSLDGQVAVDDALADRVPGVGARDVAQGAARLPEQVPQVEAVLTGRVELPTQLPYVGDADGDHGHRVHEDPARGQVGEARVAEVVFAHRAHEVAGAGAPHPHAAVGGGEVGEVDR